ncbi:hypothetical protein PoB_003020800 [Plakobranchus ocellatus]|uniref:Uncharacterized protein n=1 Tax=Plakobranchus ocellatus TaxID=259542 RepID=A0AAV4AAQ6_9GAST|nr:hypothetical protein PoB_003020800 [Plakobranchus ocellatus]
MSWRDRLALIAINAKLAWHLRASKHNEEKIGFARYPSQDDLSLEEAEIGGDPRDKITEWQAGWNVTNAIQVGAGLDETNQTNPDTLDPETKQINPDTVDPETNKTNPDTVDPETNTKLIQTLRIQKLIKLILTL